MCPTQHSTSTVMTQLYPSSSMAAPTLASRSITTPVPSPRQMSLVEWFMFKPSSTETDLPNPPPRLPSEIQYWAGVIMRNACRKDDSRGGIRQCATSKFCFSIPFHGLLTNLFLLHDRCFTNEHHLQKTQPSSMV
jgi:hypothetical protein